MDVIMLPKPHNKQSLIKPDAISLAIYQEDLLIEVSERLAIELEQADASFSDIQELLNKTDNYMLGLEHGFADITLRELATIFSLFGKFTRILPVLPNETVFKQSTTKEKIPTLTYALPNNVSSTETLTVVYQNHQTGHQRDIFKLNFISPCSDNVENNSVEDNTTESNLPYKALPWMKEFNHAYQAG